MREAEELHDNFNPGALFTQQSVLASVLEEFKDSPLRELYKNEKSSKHLMKSFYDSVTIATQLETVLLKSYVISQLKVLHTLTLKEVELNGHYKNGSVFTISSSGSVNGKTKSS